MNDLIIRFPQNPILERDTIAGYDSLFNPGAIHFGDKIILAVRAAQADIPDLNKLVAALLQSPIKGV